MSLRKLQILMPMAGLGSRFQTAGFTLPKPLIQVDGIPMFLKALSSISGIDAHKSYFFVIRQEHVDTQNLDQLIKQALPEASIIVVPKMTRGAVETAYAATPYLNPDDGLIIMDCDLWFKSASYEKMVTESLSRKSDITGGLLTFGADSPRYSYALIGKNNIVTATAEKKVISNRAITGAYFFARTQEFNQAATQLIVQPLNDDMPEYYISHLYNILINQGKLVQAAYVDQYASFGTPEELAAYESKQ